MNDNESYGIQPLSEISGSSRRLCLCGGSSHCHSCLGCLGLHRLTHGHQQKARQEVEQTTRYLVRPLRTGRSTAHTALSGPQNLYLPWMSSRDSCGHGTQRSGPSRSPRSASALALHLLGPRSEDSRVNLHSECRFNDLERHIFFRPDHCSHIKPDRNTIVRIFAEPMSSQATESLLFVCINR